MMGLPSAGVGEWEKCTVRSLIAGDRLSRCAPQPSLICDWQDEVDADEVILSVTM